MGSTFKGTLMNYRLLFCVLALLILRTPAYGRDNAPTPWTKLETQIGNTIFTVSVPGEAYISPYFNINNPRFFEGFDRMLLSQQWDYKCSRKKYNSLSCAVSLMAFRPGNNYDLKSAKGLRDAVEDARVYSHEEEMRQRIEKRPSFTAFPLEPSFDQNQRMIDNVLWASYKETYVSNSERKRIASNYVAPLDGKCFLQVVIVTEEHLKCSRNHAEWIQEAEALESRIVSSLRLSSKPARRLDSSVSNPKVVGTESVPAGKNESAKKPSVGHHGKISGNLYTFPGNIFNCTVPSFLKEGEWSDFVHANGGNVTFWDQFQLERVDYVRFDAKDEEAFRSVGAKDAAYDSFFREALLPGIYDGSPDAEIQYSGMVPIGDETIGVENLYLAYMRIPHKGNSFHGENNKKVIGDAYRGWLLYATDEKVFIVSLQCMTDLPKDRWIEELTEEFQRCSFGRWWER